MTEYRTKTGKVLTDADVDKLADEDARDHGLSLLDQIDNWVYTPGSSNVQRWAYTRSGLLLVTFKAGDTYMYGNVPEGVRDGLLEASSVGSYLARNVRGKYLATKLAKPSGSETAT